MSKPFKVGDKIRMKEDCRDIGKGEEPKEEPKEEEKYWILIPHENKNKLLVYDETSYTNYKELTSENGDIILEVTSYKKYKVVKDQVRLEEIK